MAAKAQALRAFQSAVLWTRVTTCIAVGSGSSMPFCRGGGFYPAQPRQGPVALTPLGATSPLHRPALCGQPDCFILAASHCPLGSYLLSRSRGALLTHPPAPSHSHSYAYHRICSCFSVPELPCAYLHLLPPHLGPPALARLSCPSSFIPASHCEHTSTAHLPWAAQEPSCFGAMQAVL